MARNRVNLQPTTYNKQSKSLLAQKEEEILDFWRQNKIFQKSLEKPSPKGEFVFYEGPPTANGKPGMHHFYQRAFKDLIPRFKTMQGYHVRRKAGWDTHGLPVELEVEKKLGIKSKKEIETYGIAKFNEECKKSVWTYVLEWEDFSKRMGFWLDFENPYVTYEPQYIESIWSIVKHIDDRGLLYKDYKVVPWCPRCGTALSSHELAQGYEDVKDVSVFVKFKITNNKQPTTNNTYLLAWTTTPWTLPGNVALAVGENIEYVEVTNNQQLTTNNKKEHLILAKNRLTVFDKEYEIVKELKGRDLVGLEYEPLFPYLKDNISESQKENLKNAYKVYPADFVTTEEGTGIVHTAVMYGQDDFELGTKIGLPKHHLVGEDGKFLPNTGEISGKFVKDKETQDWIINDLKSRNLLLKEELYEHSYPFCWRCNTPLIYYARDSWYIAMSKLRNNLLKENEKINWNPEYIKEGRFGEWLREVKDWAISRERYWGTPLPVWQNEKNEKIIVDSIETLKKYIPKSGNRHFGMRHGISDHNISFTCSSSENYADHVTEKGIGEIKKTAQILKSKNITKIFSSPFVRTKETAEIVAKEINFPVEKIIYDDRIREYNFGVFDQKSRNLYDEWRKENNKFDSKPDGGESFADAKKRVAEFFYDIDHKHKDENILFITHGIAFEVLPSIINGLSVEVGWKGWAQSDVLYADLREYEFVRLPHNEEYEIDLHKPYIDEIVLVKDGKEYQRVKEVMDVCFDSGSMPLSQDHYPFDSFDNAQDKSAQGKPFENTKLLYPADFICEGLDQTRGWFYTLHAIGNLMEMGHAYKNVICLGILLDEKGQKMSKSKGNVVDPWQQMEKFGADPLRYWFYAVNQPGESKDFDEKSIDEVVKKVFNLYLNSVKFYELYAEKNTIKIGRSHILDRWIISLLNKLIEEVTNDLESYKVFEAARSIREFISQLSQWYIRRSRNRFKEDIERKEASATLREVLLSLAEILAPFTPFISEDVHRRLNGEGESVHLRNWPDVGEIDEKIINSMEKTRMLTSLALEARAKAGIKIRQPLLKLKIKDQKSGLPSEFLEIIKEEVNVKNVDFDETILEEIELDTKITAELKEEGDLREIIRAFQEARKAKLLTPEKQISSSVNVDAKTAEIIEKNTDEIKRKARISFISINIGDEDSKLEINLE